MQRFNEKLVVISGGASGMGALTAKRVVEEGGTAITLDINETLGQEVANEIGNKCEFFHADVTKPDSWNDLEKYLGDRFNNITSVINAAGISEPATIEDETFDHWNRTHSINGTSVFLGCQFGVKAMKDSGSKRKTWCFIGDMTFETGIFYESYKYAKNFDLPLQFVVEDNNMSTNTPTDETWGGIKRNVPDDVIYYKYEREFPHHGTGNWVLF